MRESILGFDRQYRVVLAVIFAAALLLRLGLANYNRESNDPHIQVIRSILREGALPEKTDCSECFQPKLFHFTAAKILETIRLDQGRDADAQKIAVQMVNFISGLAILFVLWIFIATLTGIPAWVKTLGFALAAFNPQLIGINSQVTNDTFLILFCASAVFGACWVLRSEDLSGFLLVCFFSFLAVITKTNGWVAVMAVTLAFFCKALFAPGPRLSKMLSYAILYPLLVGGLAWSSPLSQYGTNFREYGSPILINIERQPPPSFFTRTHTPYAGILSIQDGFFTFKFADLLKNPVTGLQQEVAETSHRTSLWTRLYGSANSIHFENYPPSWRETEGGANRTLFAIYRGIYILALLPALVTLVGAAAEIHATIKGILTKKAAILENVSYGLFGFLFAGYLLFIILYAFEYRLYAVMKAVFIYPGLLAFIVFFLKGAHLIFRYAPAKKWALGFTVWVSVLLVLYVLDVASLIVHLLPDQSGISLILESLARNWQ